MVAGCLLLLGLRWVRRVAMWRLRNRLIVTYVFIGVIPVGLLLTIGVVAAYLFAGQFASFVISSEFTTQLRVLDAANHRAAQALAAPDGRGASLDRVASAMQLEPPNRSSTLWSKLKNGEAQALVIPSGGVAVSLPPVSQPESSSSIVGDRSGVCLRSWAKASAGAKTITVVTSEPLDEARLTRIAAGIGEVALHLPQFDAAEGRLPEPVASTPSPGAKPLAGNDEETKTAGTSSGAGVVVETNSVIRAERWRPPRVAGTGKSNSECPFPSWAGIAA